MAAALTVVAGCGGPATVGAPPASPPSADTSVVSSTTTSAASSSATTLTITDFTFAPETSTVPAGARVTVDNHDIANHTVTAIDGSFDSGNIAAGQTGSFTAPSTPGRYPYKCAIHPTMTATLVVS